MLSNNVSIAANQYFVNEIQDDCKEFCHALVSFIEEAKLAKEEVLVLGEKLVVRNRWIDTLVLDVTRYNDDRIHLRTENNLLSKQRNVNSNNAKRLYAQFTRLYEIGAITKKMHKKMLPFLEFQVDYVDDVSYNCKNVVSFGYVPNTSYDYGIVNVEQYLDAKDLLDIVNNTFTHSKQKTILRKTSFIHND